MTIKELKAALDTFNECEQDNEIVFCINPDGNTCNDYVLSDEDGCSMQFDRKNNKWKAVFYLTENSQ